MPDVLRAGYAEEAPFAFRGPDGQVMGESPEALRAVAAGIGVDSIRWVRLKFDQLIPALLQGRVDVVAAGMFLTPERASQVRFSVPTSCAGAGLVRRRGDLLQLESLADVAENRDVRIAVIAGAVEEEALRRLGVGGAQVLSVPDVRTGAVAVLTGRADAMAVTLPTARVAAAADTTAALEVVGPYDPPAGTETLLHACSALAFHPDAEDLASAADCALQSYLGRPQHVAMLTDLGLTSAVSRAGTLASRDEAACPTG